MPSTVPEARWRRPSLSRGAPILPSENPRGGAGQGLGALSAWRVLKSKRARPRSATCFLPRRSGLGRPGRQCEVTRGDRCNVVSVTPESIYQRRRNPGIASHEFGVVQVTSFPGRRGSRPSRPGTRREARRLAPRPAIAAVRTARASCRARKPKPAASRSGGPLCLRDEGRRGPLGRAGGPPQATTWTGFAPRRFEP